MAKVGRDVLKAYFKKGMIPKEGQFGTVFDSTFNLTDDYSLLGLTEYDPSRTYAAGECVVYQQAIYQAKTQTVAGPFDINYWNKISSGSANYVLYKGTWDASQNIPNLLTIGPRQGDFYVVSVAGNTNLDGITDWQLGDWAIYNGTVWQKVDNTDLVTNAQNISSGFNPRASSLSEYGLSESSQSAASKGVGVFDSLRNTILFFKSLQSPNNSIIIRDSEIRGSIDFIANINDGSSAQNTMWSSYKTETELKKKADILGSGYMGYLAELDASGNIVSSGKTTTDFMASNAQAVNIPFTPAGHITSTNVQFAIEELDNYTDTNKVDKVPGATVNNYASFTADGDIADSGTGPSNFLSSNTVAANIPVTPSGNITATNVQSALEQLDTIKETADPEIQVHIHDTTTNPHNVTKAQVGLASVDNTADMDKPVSTAQADADALVLSTAKAYTDASVVGLLNDRGNYDASSNLFPTTGGSGSGGAVRKGDLWTVSVSGTLGGTAVEVGDVIRSLVNTPGQTLSNWAITQNNISYVAENSANKITSFGTSPTDVQYPSAKLVYDQLATKEPAITGTGSSSDYWRGDKTFGNFGSAVRSTVLTGLSLATNQVINATNTVIEAFGYLQKQISDNLATLLSHTGNTSNPHNVTKAQLGLPDVINIKVNYAATVDPAVGNDNTQGYAVGSTWVNTSTGKEFVCVNAATGAAVWKETTFTTVFGSNYTIVESLPRTLTTSSTFQTKVALATGTLSGTYRIQWHAVVDNSKKAGEFRLRNTTTGTTIGIEQQFTANNPEERIPVGGFATVSLSGINTNFEIQYRAFASGDTQGIQDARLEIFRIS